MSDSELQPLYELKERDNDELRKRMKELAARYPRYGYVTLHKMLRDEGLVTNIKKTYRICHEEDLQVCAKKRKKRVPMAVPSTINER